VRVLEVKLDRKQIALTMKTERAQSASAPRPSNDERPRSSDRGPRPAPSAPPAKPAPFNNPFAAALANKSKRQ
jgi:transcriptional accessory protein Tex/SPT6